MLGAPYCGVCMVWMRMYDERFKQGSSWYCPRCDRHSTDPAAGSGFNVDGVSDYIELPMEGNSNG